MENEMSNSSGSLTRLRTPISLGEKAEWKRIAVELDQLFRSLSKAELQLLPLRVLMAIRQDREFMALSDHISDALADGHVPRADGRWQRWKFLRDQITLAEVRRFVASLQPATRSQRSMATRLGVAVPVRCSSLEAAQRLKRAIRVRRLKLNEH